MEGLEILEKIDQKIGDQNTSLDAKLSEFSDKLKPVEAEPVEKVEEAELEKGALEGISTMKVWDIPLGQALVGGFSAVVISELVDGFLAAQSGSIKGLVKLMAAGVSIKWGRKLIGTTGATALAILLAYDGLRMVIPIDEWAGKLVGGITPLTGAGLAGKAGMGNVLTQADAVVKNYYPGITARVG